MYPHSIPRHRDLDFIPGNIPGADGHCWQGCQCFQHGWNMVKQMSRLKLPLASCRWMSHDWSCHVFLFLGGWTIAGYQLFNHIFILFKTNAMSDSVPPKKKIASKHPYETWKSISKLDSIFFKNITAQQQRWCKAIDVCECLWWIWVVFLFWIASIAFICIAM